MNRAEFLECLLLGGGIVPAFPGAARETSHPIDAAGASPGYVGAGIECSGEGAHDWLAEWQRRMALPIVESDDSKLQAIAGAVWTGERLRFSYLGGSDPGEVREVTPMLLFVRPRVRDVEEWLVQHHEYRVYEGRRGIEGERLDAFDFGPLDCDGLAGWLLRRSPAYLLAWCRVREDRRCFRVDRMRLEGESGNPAMGVLAGRSRD